MLFNSVKFLFFIVVVFLLYHFPLKEKTKPQNLLLLLASYLFYGWSNWKILPLLIVSTAVIYALGIAIHKQPGDKKKSLLVLSGTILVLGALICFKYTNFFIASFNVLFEKFGLQTNISTLNILVPVGISFYTFRLLSYLIDINRGKYEPTTNFVTFATYVAFFPCILSGPIDRPNTMIPQLERIRIFNYQETIKGLRLILFGLFKKMVIADHCANIVNQIYPNFEGCTTGTLVLSAILFTFQIYTDFSGYTDMALGIAKLFGINATENFKQPFMAQNIADYWRRWHISLTSWLTDYVFMPLNIKWRNWGNFGMILSIIITFVLIGFWHGASWTFVLFGFYHGILYVPLIWSGAMFKKQKLQTNKLGLPTLKVFGKMVLTFVLVAFGLILFKAENIHQAFSYIGALFTHLSVDSAFKGWNPYELKYALILIVLLLVYEFMMEKNGESIKEWFNQTHGFIRWGVYLALTLCIIYIGVYGSGNDNSFIYFKF